VWVALVDMGLLVPSMELCLFYWLAVSLMVVGLELL